MGLALLTSGGVTEAYNYQEHKDIGNAAFAAALRRMVANGLVTDSLTLTTWLGQYGQMAYDTKLGRWFFPDLSHAPNMITYGELNSSMVTVEINLTF